MSDMDGPPRRRRSGSFYVRDKRSTSRVWKGRVWKGRQGEKRKEDVRTGQAAALDYRMIKT
jgi:hypothetical protein